MHVRFQTRVAMAATAALLVAVPLTGAARAGGSPSSTDLTGAEEVPGPGGSDATGFADLLLNQGTGQVCFVLSWADIDGTVVAAHIHDGDSGVAGPVVVPLFMEEHEGTDAVSNCVTADRALIKDIRKNPAGYYVNVHSDVFPAGAIRGQLGD
ncbi:MAG: CHRD domain-containing protein [Actinomycetota bacterium]|nr:CHRD domain-containing protein [Actinomycetota bacterium]